MGRWDPHHIFKCSSRCHLGQAVPASVGAWVQGLSTALPALHLQGCPKGKLLGLGFSFAKANKLQAPAGCMCEAGAAGSVATPPCNNC